MNPYLTLGVPRDADDQRIRRAYLDAIKQATPETDPERFKALAAAYDKIKSETDRNQHALLDRECPGDSPLDVFLKHVRMIPSPAPLPLENMKEYLRLCSRT